MECNQLNTIEYKGKITIMSHKNKGKKGNKKSFKDIINIAFKWLGYLFSIGVIGGIFYIGSLIGKIETDIGYMKENDTEIKKDFSELKNEINGKFSDLETEISSISDYLYMNDGVQDQLEDIAKVLNIVPISSSIDSLSLFIEENDISTVSSSITASTYIGLDSEGNEYYAENIIGQTVLLTCNKNKNDIYFLGQFNENYHWEGYCVTNTYNSDGYLVGICESNFDDGKRIDYKSINTYNFEQWDFANKQYSETFSFGENIVYNNINKKKKNFTNTNVRVYDIVYIDNLLDSNDINILRYYYGKTSNGYYNDESGNAYLAIYDDNDFNIKTLYVGNFIDGYFDDESAWDISYSYNGGYYVQNIGAFKNGHSLNPSHTPLSIDDINSIVDQYDFRCELNWKQ